jgi:hypothetical protein
VSRPDSLLLFRLLTSSKNEWDVTALLTPAYTNDTRRDVHPSYVVSAVESGLHSSLNSRLRQGNDDVDHCHIAPHKSKQYTMRIGTQLPSARASEGTTLCSSPSSSLHRFQFAKLLLPLTCSSAGALVASALARQKSLIQISPASTSARDSTSPYPALPKGPTGQHSNADRSQQQCLRSLVNR